MGEISHGIVFRQPPKITELDPSLPDELDVFFEQALAKDREQRFQSAKSLAGALCSNADVSLTMTTTAPHLAHTRRSR